MKTNLKITTAIFNAKKKLNYSVKQILSNNLIETRERYPYKSSDYISISDLPHLCPRREAYCLLNNHIRKEIITSKQRSIFETGNAYQDIIRDIGFYNDPCLKGMWLCKSCDYVHGSTDGKYWLNSRKAKESILDHRISRPYKCSFCNCVEFEYIEEIVVNKPLLLKGHPDGILENIRYNHVLEIKTCNDRRYKEALKNPFMEHLEQAMIYAWILKKKGIVLLYFNKNNGDYFTFECRLNAAIIGRVIERIKLLWAIVSEFEQTGTIKIIPDLECQRKNEYRAFKCEFNQNCF